MNQFNLRNLSLRDEKEAKHFFKSYIHPTEYGANYMVNKAGRFNIYAENLRDPGVQILKEAVLSVGGELVTNRDVLIQQCGTSAVVLMVTRHQAEQLIPRLKLQQFGMPQFAAELDELLSGCNVRGERVISYDGGELVFGKKTLVMGILNFTPDSFSDGGQWFDFDKAVDHALQMEEDGADIIDIGGESTRPAMSYTNSSQFVTAEEEQRRILPVIEALAGKLHIPISVDTYKAETARAALNAGAKIINDIWGFQYDNGEMAAFAAEADCPVILMHNQKEPVYEDFMGEMMAYLRRSIDIALEAGCNRNKLIVDPGFGFAKGIDENFMATVKIQEMASLGCPILMAASRKKSIRTVLDVSADDCLFGDAAVTALSIAYGADMIRVHDVKEMAQVAKMTDAILNRGY